MTNDDKTVFKRKDRLDETVRKPAAADTGDDRPQAAANAMPPSPEPRPDRVLPGTSDPAESAADDAPTPGPQETILQPRRAQPGEAETVLKQAGTAPGHDQTVAAGGQAAVAVESAGSQNSGGTGRQSILEPGAVINNRFVIDQLLGSGGMGMVYRALDKRKEEAEDRDPFVAIKILSDEFRRHPKSMTALQREARKSQTLAHPNIITVYDFDRDGDVVYMTMEELRGQPLDELIRNHPRGLPPKKAVQLIKAIAAGLQYAHSKGIVHSDLKPANVFITDDDQVKILDFGIAQAVSSIESRDGDKTVFDARTELGGLTPAYASHEVWEGDEPHPSDDIYALGLIGYELLTGLHPYFRKSATVAAEEQLTARRLSGLKSYQARILHSAIAIRRSDRPADAGEFLLQFDRAPLSKKIAASLAILLGAVVLLSVLAVNRPGQLDPDVPFVDLTPEVQSAILADIDNGSQALALSLPYDALFYFNRAWELHPRNPDATRGLASAVETVLNKQYEGSLRARTADQLEDVTNLLSYPSLAEDPALTSLRETLQERLSDESNQ